MSHSQTNRLYSHHSRTSLKAFGQRPGKHLVRSSRYTLQFLGGNKVNVRAVKSWEELPVDFKTPRREWLCEVRAIIEFVRSTSFPGRTFVLSCPRCPSCLLCFLLRTGQCVTLYANIRHSQVKYYTDILLASACWNNWFLQETLWYWIYSQCKPLSFLAVV